MSDPEDIHESRGRPLLNVLFWVGVGLAPIAALLLLVGQGNGPLRIAAVLAVLAVVLIGLSITLRGDAETVRQNIEDTLFEEIDELRGGVRNDIATAARATHKAFGEKLQIMQDNVEALRAQVEANRAASGRSEGGPAASVRGESVGWPRTDRTETDTGDYAARDYAARDYGQGGHDRGESGYAGSHGRARPAGQHADPVPPARPPGQYGRSGGHQQPSMPSRSRGGREVPPGGVEDVLPRPHLPGGVVRHTETVQVTTRQTIVGAHGHDSGAGNGYGAGAYDGRNASGGGNTYGGDGHDASGYPDQGAAGHARGQRTEDDGGDWSAQPSRGRRSAAPAEHPQADQRIPAQRGGEEPDPRRYEPEEDHTGDPADDGYWSSLRAGGRWATVRSDDHGREVRMGERRAAMRADESGTELRVEDRWAAVRREEPRRAEPGRQDARQDGTQWEEPRGAGGRRRAGERADRGGDDDGDRADRDWDDDRTDAGLAGDRGRDRRGGMPALPAGGVAPPEAWRPGQAGPDREPVRQRRHGQEGQYGHPPADEAPRAGGARRPDYEYSEDRWR